MKKYPTAGIATVLFVSIILFATLQVVAQTVSGTFAQGVKLFNKKAYAEAIEQFKKAELENSTNYAAFLWHGLAVMASGNDLASVNEAAQIWSNRSAWDNSSQALAQYFTGLGYWRVGYNGQAKLWFSLTESFQHTAGYRLAQAASKSLDQNGAVPSISTWASMAGLLGTGEADGQPLTHNKTAGTETAPKNKNTADTNKPAAELQPNSVNKNTDGTLGADRPILQCPVAQKQVKNGTPPDLKIIEKVFRCQSGEKAAAKGMDGAFIINVEDMKIGKPRLLNYLHDKGDGIPNQTVVYPIRITWTEKTFYRTRTAVVEKKIAVVNFNVNSMGEWQYGSATPVSDGTYKSIAVN